MCRERVNESIANRKAVSKRRFEAPRKLESGFRRLVSRPRGFHLEPLAEPCVNLSIYTAPMTQPFPQRHSSGRTALEMRSSSGAASPHGAACAATVACTCVWPIAQAFDRYTERACASPSDKTPRSNSTSRVSPDCIASPVRPVSPMSDDGGAIPRKSIQVFLFPVPYSPFPASAMRPGRARGWKPGAKKLALGLPIINSQKRTIGNERTRPCSETRAAIPRMSIQVFLFPIPCSLFPASNSFAVLYLQITRLLCSG